MASRGKPPSGASQAGGDTSHSVPTNYAPSEELLGISGSTQSRGVQLMPRGFTLTMPEDDDIYGVKEDQLNELVTGGRSWSLELALACGGVAFGYIPSAIDTAQKIAKSEPVTWWDIGFISVFVALIVVAALKGHDHKKSASSISTLKTKITSGQKMKVGS